MRQSLSSCNLMIFTEKIFCVTLFGLVFFQIVSGQTAPEAISLELNKPIEREIGGEQKHVYQIKLSANQYANIALEQRGVNVAALLTDAAGKTLVSFDAEMRPNRPEKLEYVANTDGTYRIEVQPVYKLLPAGKYEIKLIEIRAAEPANDALLESRTLFSEASRNWSNGQYAEARIKVERVIEMRLRTVGAENRTTVAAFTLLARIQRSQGKYDESLQTIQRVLAIREKTLEPDHPDLAITFELIGLIYRDKEDFQNAILYHNKAKAVREEAFGQIHPTVAASLINLGGIFNSLGDNLKAQEFYLQALAILEKSVGENDNNTGIVLFNIGKSYIDTDQYEKAESFLQRALVVFEKLYPSEHPRILTVNTSLALISQQRGDLDSARARYQSILATREKTLGDNHPENGFPMLNLAHIAALKGENELAETLYRRILKIWEDSYGPESSNVSLALNGLALLLAQKGDIKQALTVQKRAAAIDERDLNLNLAIGSERQKIAYLEKMFEQINQNIFLQIRFAADEPEAVELAATTILRQKGRVMDALANNLSILRERLDKTDQKTIDKLNETTNKLANLILEGRGEMPLAEYQAKVKDLTDEREQLEENISRLVSGVYTKSPAISLSVIQSLIPQDTALIEFIVYKTVESDLAANIRKSKTDELRYAVYVLPKEGAVKWKDLGSAEEINQLLENYRQTLRDPKRKDSKEIARATDEKIMQPIRAFLGETKRLLISPDGDLNLIPFEALVDEQNRYLVENYSFTYLTSGRDLLRMQNPQVNSNNPLVVVNPLFGVSIAESLSTPRGRRKRKSTPRSRTATRNLSDTYFAPLSGTIEEGRVIQSLFPDATFLNAAQATETALKQTRAPRILHIATHGFFLQNTKDLSLSAANRSELAEIQSGNPLVRSGLALAGANQRGSGGEDDGILTALEASGLNLRATKLVVLSACDTGLGEVKNGEGVYGLRRSFVLAGAESLIMSLWAVDDYVTRKLMTDYYKNIKQGLGRGASLRQVQLEMLKTPSRQHPFYWASFIQSGEWANLDGIR